MLITPTITTDFAHADGHRGKALAVAEAWPLEPLAHYGAPPLGPPLGPKKAIQLSVRPRRSSPISPSSFQKRCSALLACKTGGGGARQDPINAQKKPPSAVERGALSERQWLEPTG